MKSEIICPQHHACLLRLPVLYGLPIPGRNYDDVILGGCVVDDEMPAFAYRCHEGREVYFQKDGHLVLWSEMDEDDV